MAATTKDRPKTSSKDDAAAKAKAKEREAKEKAAKEKAKAKEREAKEKARAAREKEKEREAKAKEKAKAERQKEKEREAKAKEKAKAEREKEKAREAKEKERAAKAKEKQKAERQKEKEREAKANDKQRAEREKEKEREAKGKERRSGAGTGPRSKTGTSRPKGGSPTPTVHEKGWIAEELGKAGAVQRSTKRPTLAASFTTRDHDVIRRWAESRGGVPADVRGTGDGNGTGGAGVLRIEFRDDADRLEDVGWDAFFATFEDSDVDFLYQEFTKDGGESRFHKIVRADS